ncbi:tRNA (guanine-N(1)-)-methyltransferase [Ancylostoma duodenale]|uniref:tRNA (Guanine-N(1)-)-methyltransferase n=1 Tax=Ancylostoma duodenale TaxID=51022 RepID=A0A0C2DYB1_9BILA|nr:tRNA (guanine-N(1)-)-methyltransferase [Ancylostoma duodenale]
MRSVEAAGNTFQYADLNIRHTGNADRTLAMVKRAIRMGYDTVAINIDIGDIVPEEAIEEHLLPKSNSEETFKPPPKKKAKKNEDRKVGLGFTDYSLSSHIATSVRVVSSNCRNLSWWTNLFWISLTWKNRGRSSDSSGRVAFVISRVSATIVDAFSRITFTLNDATVIHNVFNNPRLRQFDLVAVRPADVNILTTLTRKTDAVDIITMNPETHVTWLHKSKFMEMIRVEGVGFEITYAPAFFPANRRAVSIARCFRKWTWYHYCLHSGRFLIRGLRGRGVVMTSGASSMYELRAPVDVMNMTILWGVSGADARPMISGGSCFDKCRYRKHLKFCVIASKVLQESSKLMKWLENLRLWSVWKIRRIFRLQGQAIAPIQWGEPLLKTLPDKTLGGKLTPDQAMKLGSIVREVKVGVLSTLDCSVLYITILFQTISMLTKHFPSKITDDDWLVLLECHTRKQRLDHLKFLRTRELEKKKDLERKRMKVIPASAVGEGTSGEHYPPLYYPAARLAKEQRRQLWQRVARAHLCGAPSLVVDCRFLPLLSPRGAELTALQLKYLITENRDSRTPWQLYFVNFDLSTRRFQHVKERHLSVIDSSMSSSPIVLPNNYTKVFPRKRVVYLSPDAEEELVDVNDEDVKVYVLGGIVDRVVERGIPRQASLETALADRVSCKKLPLEKYVKWKSGTKFLTLTAVSSILRDVNSSRGDWESALRRCVVLLTICSVEHYFALPTLQY